MVYLQPLCLLLQRGVMRMIFDEVAKRKGLSHEIAYKYVNGVMDTIRIVLLQNDEVEIGGFGTLLIVKEDDI